jgi:hypothetical protein
VARLHGEALTLVGEVASGLSEGTNDLTRICENAASRLRVLIDQANAIANGEVLPGRGDAEMAGDVGGQAAIDAMFGTR